MPRVFSGGWMGLAKMIAFIYFWIAAACGAVFAGLALVGGASFALAGAVWALCTLVAWCALCVVGGGASEDEQLRTDEWDFGDIENEWYDWTRDEV